MGNESQLYDRIMPVLRSCTGFQFDVCGFQDSHPRLPVTVRHGFSLAVSWSPTKVVVTATMETSVLQLQVRSYGTAFRLICDKLTLTFNDLNGY